MSDEEDEDMKPDVLTDMYPLKWIQRQAPVSLLLIKWPTNERLPKHGKSR
jgi:hypothetical protein